METIAIIGSGLIGRGWTIVFARAGHPVKLHDNAPGAVERACGMIRDSLDDLRRAGLLAETAEVVMRRISPVATLAEAVADADYVQENTAERVDVKRAIFRELDAAAPAECILASSTSTIQTSCFTEDLKGRHRCIVAHPANPPHVLPIVEISPAPWTSPEVVDRTRGLQQKVGQVPITLQKEVEGFILNRLQAAVLLEAWRLVRENYASVEDVDRCIKEGLGLRWALMGPFETIDLNAPGGVADYAERYGPLMYGMMKDVKPEPWDRALIAKVEQERRRILPASDLVRREAWRDRRLMALVAHKRAEDEAGS
jgi:L-gulonate 3-dehydrogenase